MALGPVTYPDININDFNDIRASIETTSAQTNTMLDTANEAFSTANAANSTADTVTDIAEYAVNQANATKTIAGDTQAVIDKITQNGGFSILHITFSSEFVGKQYIITDRSDETQIGIVPASCVVNALAVDCNMTYTISSTIGSTTYSTTVTTGNYFGEYSVLLTTFSATINVTTIAEATVTATDGDYTYSATTNNSGQAAIVVKRAGTYTVRARQPGKSSTSAEVNVTTNGATYSSTVMFILPVVPSQSTALIYTGRSRSPSWNNYNENELTIGGTISGTNAGTYVATFTPKACCQWEDGTRTAKSVNWTINKADCGLSLNPTSLALNEENDTGTITVTRAGNGAITAESSDTSVATISVAGTNVTVTAMRNGTAIITVNVAAGTNHNAASKTVSVTATNIGPRIHTGIADLSPADIDVLAYIISDMPDVDETTSSVTVTFQGRDYKISVGDSRNVNFGDEVREVVVVGFNHSSLANQTAYGASTTTGKAGIIFQTKDCLNTKYQMNSSNTNSGGWGGSAFRTSLQSTIKNTISSDLRAVIKTVLRNVGKGGSSSGVDSCNDSLFLPTECEVFGSVTHAESGESGPQLPYYAAGNSKIKKCSGSNNIWMLCSPVKNNSTNFVVVGSSGALNHNTASNTRGAAPCFCI